MTREHFKALLTSVVQKCYYIHAEKAQLPYIVYVDLSANYLRADDRISEQENRYFVQYYTNVADDPKLEQLVDVLDAHLVVVDWIPEYDIKHKIITHNLTCRTV